MNTDLYNQAKEAYYNGNPIMSDQEFDELERSLGLENKGYIGTVNNVSYTVAHPVLMGSLSKIQIKEDKDTKTIQFDKYLSDLKKYMDKTKDCPVYEVTPKFDGASIELVFDRFGMLLSASTRGDGKYGKDINIWYQTDYIKNKSAIKELCKKILSENEKLVVRGECLIKIKTFLEKYQHDFANPRAWVAGCIGQKWENTPEQQSYREDLNFVFYTFIKINERNTAYELSFQNVTDGPYTDSAGIGEYPKDIYYINKSQFDPDNFKELYQMFVNIRENSEYALDGFVIKPTVSYRLNDFSRERPEESVAIKFVPEILQSVITDIIWKLGKNKEWYPTAVLEPVYMDGKKIMKASLHNYNYIMSHNAHIGSIVRISLAGDIIPFVYEIIGTDEKYETTDKYRLPENSKVVSEESGIEHLMINQMDKMEEIKMQFIQSAETLNLNNIGPKTAAKIWDALYNAHYCLWNICELFDDTIKQQLIKVLGESKSTDNIMDTLNKAPYVLTLEQVINSCNFPSCGNKASKRIAEMIYLQMTTDHIITADDFKGLNSEAWSWVLDGQSVEWEALDYLYEFFEGKGKNIFTRIDLNNQDDSQIKIIMTGGPEGMTKKEWLAKHPEYIETTKWNECKILFCNDLNSTSSKMKKAQKLGIEIKLYN